jgi:hypothetical protein
VRRRPESAGEVLEEARFFRFVPFVEYLVSRETEAAVAALEQRRTVAVQRLEQLLSRQPRQQQPQSL